MKLLLSFKFVSYYFSCFLVVVVYIFYLYMTKKEKKKKKKKKNKNQIICQYTKAKSKDHKNCTLTFHLLL